MKKLLTTTGLSLLLISTAGVSYGQAAICSPRTLIGGPNIVAELGICPAGYSRVGTTSSSGSSSAGGLFQNSVNDMVENARRNNERMAAERGAARQRAHEMEMLERQLEAQNARSSADRSQAQANSQTRIEAQRSGNQNPNSTTRNGAFGFERWEVTMEMPQGNLSFNLTAHNNCSLTFYTQESGVARVSEVSRTSNTLSFQSTVESNTGQLLTLYFDIDINRDRLTGQVTSDLGRSPLQGRRVSGTGNVPQQCITTRSTRNVAAEDRDAEPEARERATSLVEDLRSLGELHEQGILTDEEFSAAKRRLLGL